MRIDIQRAKLDGGRVNLRFWFDGKDAGELTLDQHSWLVWRRLMDVGVVARARDGVVVELNIRAADPLGAAFLPPPAAQPAQKSTTKRPEARVALPLSPTDDESDVLADTIIGGLSK